MYLPEGVWFDFWSDERHMGGRHIKAHAELDSLPLFVRQGSIIPMGPDLQYSSECSLDPLTLEIFRGANGAFTLYEDDGESTANQKGAYVEIRFELTDTREEAVLRLGESHGSFAGHQSERSAILNFHYQPRVRGVYCDGALIHPLLSAESLQQADIGWWRDEKKQIISIKLSRADAARVVTLS